MAAQALRTDGRHEPRMSVACRATARVSLSLEVIDASSGGLRVRASVPLPLGSTLKIGLPGGTERHAKIVWRDGDVFGCEFMAPLDAGALAELLAATRTG